MKKLEKLIEPKSAPTCSDKIWFLLMNEKTFGPLTTQEIEFSLAGKEGALIWWRGAEQWIVPPEWRKIRDSVIRSRCPTFFLDSEKLVPKTLNETVTLLKTKDDPNSVKLWLPEQEQSRRAFEIENLCEALGLKTRRQARAFLDGTVVIKSGNTRIMAQIKSVSAGGMGAEIDSEAQLSGEVTIWFHCLEFFNMAPVTADVVFCRGGNVGFRFKTISAESRNTIVTYIRENYKRAA